MFHKGKKSHNCQSPADYHDKPLPLISLTVDQHHNSINNSRGKKNPALSANNIKPLTMFLLIHKALPFTVSFNKHILWLSVTNRKKNSLDLEDICKRYSLQGCWYLFSAHTGSCSVTVEQPASWQQNSSHLQGISRFHCRPSNANTKNNCHIQTGAEMTGWVSIHLVCPGLSFLFAAMKSWNCMRTPR